MGAILRVQKTRWPGEKNLKCDFKKYNLTYFFLSEINLDVNYVLRGPKSKLQGSVFCTHLALRIRFWCDGNLAKWRSTPQNITLVSNVRHFHGDVFQLLCHFILIRVSSFLF